MGPCAGRWSLPQALIHLLLTLLVRTQVAGASRCHGSDVEDCLRPLDPLTTHQRTILPSYDSRTLTNVCRSFQQMAACLEPLRPACGASRSRVYAGVKRARDFLCGDGLHEYGNHRVCFAKDALAAEGGACNLTRTQRRPATYRGRRTTYTGICQDADRFMTCVKDAVLRHCGGGAALWVENVNNKVFTPLLEGSGCNQQRTNVRVAIVFGLTIAIFILMLGTVVVSSFCYRKRSRSDGVSLRMLATSLEDQNDLSITSDKDTQPCPCRLTYTPQPALRETPVGTADGQTQISTFSDNLIRINNCSTGFELLEVVTEIESETDRESDNKEEEIDQSCPSNSSYIHSGRLKDLMHTRRTYSILPSEEQHEEYEDGSRTHGVSFYDDDDG